MSKLCLKLMFILSILFYLPKETTAQDLTIRYKSHPLQTTTIRTITFQDIRFLSVYTFADLLNARTDFNAITKQVDVHMNDSEMRITAFNPFIIIDERAYQLTTDTQMTGNEIYIPLHAFLDLMTYQFPDRINFYKSQNVLEIISVASSNITRIEIEEKANGYLIKIETTRNFDSSEIGIRDRHGWLYVDIYGGKADSLSLSRTFKKGIVSMIVPHQVSDQLAQIGFKLREEILEKQYYLDNPNQILVSLKTKKNISEKITKELEKEKEKWLIDKLVIDPGHGGKDPGAVGKNSHEKNITLAIAFELKKLLQERTNIKVLMTRDDDRFVELKQRTEFANRNEAKLFLSIHANSNRSRKLNGVSTYFLGPENTDEAREVALLENSVIKYESESKYADLTNENFILSAMAQNIYTTESEDFGAIVQYEISKRCGLKNRGVRQAGFYVLWGASMPSVLVETAFISHPQEEKKLNSFSFQKDIAMAIFNAIMEFKKKYERGI